jgi:aminomethyltransferase
MSLQRTPLFPMHQKYKGKLIDFGGWELPVEYQGIISEHKMVRSKAGMFDVSHMGEVEVTGERSLEYLNNLELEKLKTQALFEPLDQLPGMAIGHRHLFGGTF